MLNGRISINMFVKIFNVNMCQPTLVVAHNIKREFLTHQRKIPRFRMESIQKL